MAPCRYYRNGEGRWDDYQNLLQVVIVVCEQITAWSCYCLHTSPGLRWTDASSPLTHLLGDGTTLTRMCSTGCLHRIFLKIWQCLRYCKIWRERSRRNAVSCAIMRASAFVSAVPHSSGRVVHGFNCFHGKLSLNLNGFSLSASSDSGLGSLDCSFHATYCNPSSQKVNCFVHSESGWETAGYSCFLIPLNTLLVNLHLCMGSSGKWYFLDN